MTIISRDYIDEVDHLMVMDFLRKTFAETGSLENWLPPRFENNSREMDFGIRLWEDEGKLVGFVVPEDPLIYFIQLHPDYFWLYDLMVEWIEVFSRNAWGAEKTLKIIEADNNQSKPKFLSNHGYKRDGIYGIFRVRDVDTPIPDYPLPQGFSVRSVTPDDFDEIAKCIRQVFGHGDWFTRDILEKTASASFYQPPLDLVVLNKTGKIVSFCTFRIDLPSGVTELEPMGTLQEYRGLGIGRALLCEGFRRLSKFNPTLLYIGGAANNPAANRLYELTDFKKEFNLYKWEKIL